MQMDRSYTLQQLLYLQSSIILALSVQCKLTQEEVSYILQNTSLLEYIEMSYEIYHVEGMYSILDDIKEYLKSRYNITIKFKAKGWY